MKNKKKKLLFSFFILIILSTFFLGIGYAQISDIIVSVSGTASADRQEGLVISDISYLSSVNANIGESNINTYFQNILDSTITLNSDPTSSITYQVKIKNLTNENNYFKSVIYDSMSYDNPNITYELSGINVGDIVRPNEEITFNLTFKYQGTDVSNNVLNSILLFKFKKESDVTVTFNSNGGTAVEPKELQVGNTIGELQHPTKEICENDTGTTPEERGCSYIGVFQGWYLEPTLDTQIDSNYVVTSDMTLYAKWHSTFEMYRHLDVLTFNGIDDFIDTGINLFNDENLNKDFDVNMDLLTVEQTSNTQPSILNSKDETSSTYPGFVIRLNTNSITNVSVNSRWNNNNQGNQMNLSNLPIHFEIKRRNGVVTLKITGTNQTVGEKTIFNQSAWALDRPHPKNISLGGIYNANGLPDRFFKGSISNVVIKVYE